MLFITLSGPCIMHHKQQPAEHPYIPDAYPCSSQAVRNSVIADKLEKLMAAKRKSLEGDPQIKLKLIKYALTRGYEYDEIQRYL